jgi:hypothetical protein
LIGHLIYTHPNPADDNSFYAHKKQGLTGLLPSLFPHFPKEKNPRDVNCADRAGLTPPAPTQAGVI